MSKRLQIAIGVVAAIVVATLFAGCSARKNTAANRKYQAFITRYNVYYNGDEHYRETLADMERNYEDDYTDFLFPHPAEAKGAPKAPQPSGDFKRSIEKAQKAIQLHSIKKKPKKKAGKQSDAYKAWLKREEYNPFIHNAWMMMARSQYLDGDFPGAAATFYYISRHFSWLPETVVEAQLWQARSYVASDWVNEADAIFQRIKPEQLTSGKLKALYDFVEADIAMRRGDYQAAIGPLERTIKRTSGAQKTRLRFLLGQCYARMGRNAEAYKVFKQAAEAGDATYRTKLNARIKQSEVYSGKDITPEVKALKRMTSLDRNKPYLDQIYYAIGNLYLSRGDTAQAIENYILAADKSERNGIEKAISDITLGQIYYTQGRYDLAQPRFSEAVPKLPETYADYELLKRRSDVLDELAVYAQNVVTQDSLLRLAEMTPEEQLKVINKIIDELKKKEKEEAEEAARQAHEAEAAANQTGNTDPNAPTEFQMSSKDDSWYFYNSATVSAGRTAFQRKWGSRKLEDDWRRRNKSSFSFSDFGDTETADADGAETAEGAESPAAEESEADKQAAERATDPHFPEYYLAQIPKTDEEKANAHNIIQEGLYTMGTILKDKLEDFPAAEVEWKRLLDQYPDNVYRLDVYYNMYIMLMRMERADLAEQWRQLILSDFADSKYGIALQNPDYIQNLREMPAAQQALYDAAYAAYLNNNNPEVHRAYETMMQKYPVSDIMPKFMFLHALSYVTEGDANNFSTTLRELLERYPQTDLTPLASGYLKGLKEGRKLHEGSSNTRSMLWDIRLSLDGDSLKTADSAEAANFDFDPNQPQILVLAYPTDTIAPNELLYQVARHNFNSFVVKDFDLEQMNFGRLGMLLVKGFANEGEAQHYRTLLGRSTVFTLPQQVRPFIISEANFAKLISGGRSLEEYFRAAGDEAFDRVDPEGELPDE